jgi:hypothetical protein
MALFTEANITTAMVGYDRDANGALLMRPEPTVLASEQEALAIYARRKDAIRDRMSPAYAQHVDEWERLLASPFFKGTHFQIEFIELNYMYEAGQFELALRAWLKGIETIAGPGWEDLCERANLSEPLPVRNSVQLRVCRSVGPDQCQHADRRVSRWPTARRLQ